MCVDEFLAGLICFLFLAGRSKESLQMPWEMGVHKRQERGDERVVLSLHWAEASKASCFSKTVQSERKQHRDFDSTKGFPGEDLQLELVGLVCRCLCELMWFSTSVCTFLLRFLP